MAKDFKGIFGSSILSFVEETIGSVVTVDEGTDPTGYQTGNVGNKVFPYVATDFKRYALGKDVFAYIAEIRDEPDYKVLFTVGLFAYQMKECFICLPSSWFLPRYTFDDNFLNSNLTEAPYFPETLPLDILREIVTKSTRKNTAFKIEEGSFLDKTKKPWNTLNWSDDLVGMVMVDYMWESEEGGNEPEEMSEDDVGLFTLTPVLDKKDLNSDWYQQRLYGKWCQFVLPIFADIELVEKMNKALVDKDLEEMKSLVTKGINVNRGVYREHSQHGFIFDSTYLEYLLRPAGLEKVFGQNVFDMIKFLVEKGAKFSSAMLAKIAGNASIELFDYFLNFGCDINAIDNLGYSALNRAYALKNHSLVKHIISLDGKYYVTKFDTKEKLQPLKESGAILDYSNLED